YIVMERLTGEDLGSRLRREGRLQPAELVRVVCEIAEAVDAAHDAGVVHRDLKPSNIFLADRGRVVLLDFGISKIPNSGSPLPSAAVLLVSPSYFAPEMPPVGADGVGQAVDISALGGIEFRAATGRAAFGPTDIVAAISQVANAEPLPPSEVAPPLP